MIICLIELCDVQPGGTALARTIVRKYKGDRALNRGIKRMTSRGYEVQSHCTRKAMFAWGRALLFLPLGLFTGKQIHTVIFTKAKT